MNDLTGRNEKERLKLIDRVVETCGTTMLMNV